MNDIKLFLECIEDVSKMLGFNYNRNNKVYFIMIHQKYPKIAPIHAVKAAMGLAILN